MALAPDGRTLWLATERGLASFVPPGGAGSGRRRRRSAPIRIRSIPPVSTACVCSVPAAQVRGTVARSLGEGAGRVPGGDGRGTQDAGPAGVGRTRPRAVGGTGTLLDPRADRARGPFRRRGRHRWRLPALTGPVPRAPSDRDRHAEAPRHEPGGRAEHVRRDLVAGRPVLFVAFFFPPLGGGGVQRSLKFVRYLPGARLAAAGPDRRSRLLDARSGAARRGAAGHAGAARALRRPPSARPWAGGGGTRSRAVTRLLRVLSRFLLVPDAYVGWSRRAARVGEDEICATSVCAPLHDLLARQRAPAGPGR